MKKTLFLFLLSTIFLTLNCKKEPDRTKFFGSYNVADQCDGNTFSYAITIVESSNGEEAIIINNFGGFTPTINVRATVTGNRISINDSQSGITISGSGDLNGSALIIVYTYTSSASGFTGTCTSTCIKQ